MSVGNVNKWVSSSIYCQQNLTREGWFKFIDTFFLVLKKLTIGLSFWWLESMVWYMWYIKMFHGPIFSYSFIQFLFTSWIYGENKDIKTFIPLLELRKIFSFRSNNRNSNWTWVKLRYVLSFAHLYFFSS